MLELVVVDDVVQVGRFEDGRFGTDVVMDERPRGGVRHVVLFVAAIAVVVALLGEDQIEEVRVLVGAHFIDGFEIGVLKRLGVEADAIEVFEDVNPRAIYFFDADGGGHTFGFCFAKGDSYINL